MFLCVCKVSGLKDIPYRKSNLKYSIPFKIIFMGWNNLFLYMCHLWFVVYFKLLYAREKIYDNVTQEQRISWPCSPKVDVTAMSSDVPQRVIFLPGNSGTLSSLRQIYNSKEALFVITFQFRAISQILYSLFIAYCFFEEKSQIKPKKCLLAIVDTAFSLQMKKIYILL